MNVFAYHWKEDEDNLDLDKEKKIPAKIMGIKKNILPYSILVEDILKTQVKYLKE